MFFHGDLVPGGCQCLAVTIPKRRSAATDSECRLSSTALNRARGFRKRTYNSLRLAIGQPKRARRDRPIVRLTSSGSRSISALTPSIRMLVRKFRADVVHPDAGSQMFGHVARTAGRPWRFIGTLSCKLRHSGVWSCLGHCSSRLVYCSS